MLFRRQVIEKRQSRLYGSVIISTPLAFWAVAALLIGILVVAVTFSAVSNFARIEPVRGVVVPSGGVATIRANAVGVLRGFDLAEGDTVTSGQNLGQITTDGAIEGEGTRLSAELSRIETRIANLESQQRQTGTVSDIEISSLVQENSRIEARIEQLNSILALKQDALTETRAVFDRFLTLADQNFASESQLSAERLRVIAAEQQVVDLQNQLAELAAELRDLPRRREDIEARSRLSQLRIQVDIDSLVSERAILLANQSYAVTAPVSGRVSAVRARSGHEVRQGEPLFSILPMERAVQAELYVPSRAIGFVETGLDVRLLLDAFPYQRFGTAQGEIVELTTAVLQPGTGDTPVQIEEPVFRATVSLASDFIEHDGREHALQVGMALTANIILEERTILSRVIEPIISVLRRY